MSVKAATTQKHKSQKAFCCLDDYPNGMGEYLRQYFLLRTKGGGRRGGGAYFASCRGLTVFTFSFCPG